jgi:translation initiation factor IF-2
MMEDEKIGIIVKFFAKPSVAAIELTDGSLKVGDTIRIHGHSTDFQQVIDSMQIEHASVTIAEKGASIGIKVKERVREHDVVYLVKQ